MGLEFAARHMTFALDDEMQLQLDVVEDFLERYGKGKFIIFGFTFMVWQNLFQALKAKASDVDEIFTLPVLEPLRAVAGEASRVQVKVCRVADRPGIEIEIETKPDETSAVVTAYRNEGLTTDLDGFALVDEDGTSLGRFENGKCTIVNVKAFAGRPLALCDAQGNALHALIELR